MNNELFDAMGVSELINGAKIEYNTDVKEEIIPDEVLEAITDVKEDLE